MAYKEIYCDNLGDYCKITLDWCDKNHWVVFRGHGDIKYQLLPSIARNKLNSIENLKKFEKEIFSRFKTNLKNTLSDFQIDSNDELGFLTVGQHYGLETRLLDWSASPLCALYFAAQNVVKTASEFCVWACCIDENDHREINFFDSKISQKPFDIDITYMLKPKSFSERIKAQASWFTLHHCHSKKGFISLDENLEYKEDLAKIIFPSKVADKLRNELDILHVNEATQFPDDIKAEIRHIIWKSKRNY